MLVKLWMSKNLVTVSNANTIADAKETIEENNIRRLPVVNENNQLVGILSKEDIMNALPSTIDAAYDESARALSAQAKVEAFMTQTPITAGPAEPLEKVAVAMREHKIGGVPVVENDNLVGIITESDIFRAFIEILGSSKEGARLEIAIDYNTDTLYEVVNIFKKHDSSINAINICNDYSKNHQLVTIRFKSDNKDELVGDLWDSGARITSILDEKDN